MFKKYFIILICLLLTSCSYIKKNDDIYIEPFRDIFIYEKIDTDSQTKIKIANGNKEYKNYQFKMLGKDIYDKQVIDINGNSINLKDYNKLLFEVVSVDCEHCKDLIVNHLNEMMNYDFQLVQYFDVGNKQEIIDFYKRLNINIPDKLIIIEHNDDLRTYISDYLGLKSYPSMISYLNQKVSFNTYSDISSDSLIKYNELSFEKPLSIDSNIIALDRTSDDVKNDLSLINQEKLEALDNDNYTCDLTYLIIGSKLDYETISNSDSDLYINEVKNFKEYKDKDLILIYSYLKKETDIEKIKFINELIDSNSEYEYLVLLSEGLDTSSNIYRKLNYEFHAPVVSMSAALPDSFVAHGMAGYPSAVFIKNNTFMGAYSKIESIDKFKDAIDLFMSEDSIALKANNQNQ